MVLLAFFGATFLASQFWVTGEIYKRRPDLIGFVNGLPLIFIELKTTHKNVRDAFDNNLKDYKQTIPQLFWYQNYENRIRNKKVMTF